MAARSGRIHRPSPDDPVALAQWGHAAYTVKQAPQILDHVGFPAAKVPAVLDVIRTHQPHDTPSSCEAVILRDADILEQLGAMGILRTVCKVGRDTRFRTFTDAVAALRRNLDSLPALLALETSRALAAPRIDALRSFLMSVDAEAEDRLF